MNEQLERLADKAENDDLEFILKALALDVEYDNWDTINCFAHKMADVQDKVLKQSGIEGAPRPFPKVSKN